MSTKTLKRMASDESAAEALYREAVARLAADPGADMHGIEGVLADAGRTRGDLEADVALLCKRREASFQIDSDDGTTRLSAARLLRLTSDPNIEVRLDELRGRRQWILGQAAQAEKAYRSISDWETKLTAAQADVTAAEIGGRGGHMEREKVARLRLTLQRAKDDAGRGDSIRVQIQELDAEMARVERQKLDPSNMRWSVRD